MAAESDVIARYVQVGLDATLAGRIAKKAKSRKLVDGVLDEAKQAGLDFQNCPKKVHYLLNEPRDIIL